MFALITALVVGSGCTLFSLEGAPSPAVGATGPVVAPPVLGDDELIIREIFRSHLPSTLSESTLRISVHPHFGDFGSKDHLRITPGFRYGVTRNWEISASSDLYVSHGSGEISSFDRYGVAIFQFGAKVNLGQPWIAGWEVGTGFDYSFPTGHPPAELTDGLRHFMPYVTFSRRLESRPGLRVFWGLRADLVTRTSLTGVFKKNDLRDSSTGVTGGFVIDRKNWHYTFEASFDTTRSITGSDAEMFMIRPGVIWEILSRRNGGERSNWVVGVAVSGRSGPAGESLGFSMKLRYNFNLKRPAPPATNWTGPPLRR